jgi:hypothetical protein
MSKSNPELYTKFTPQEKMIIKSSIIFMSVFSFCALMAFSETRSTILGIGFGVLLLWIIIGLWSRKGNPAGFIFWFHH